METVTVYGKLCWPWLLLCWTCHISVTLAYP